MANVTETTAASQTVGGPPALSTAPLPLDYQHPGTAADPRRAVRFSPPGRVLNGIVVLWAGWVLWQASDCCGNDEDARLGRTLGVILIAIWTAKAVAAWAGLSTRPWAPGDRRRWSLAPAVVGLVAGLVVVDAPMRGRFAVSWPFMHALAGAALASPRSGRPPSWVGAYHVEWSQASTGAAWVYTRGWDHGGSRFDGFVYVVPGAATRPNDARDRLAMGGGWYAFR